MRRSNIIFDKLFGKTNLHVSYENLKYYRK
nr:MAG TPA: hypothetical protein [Crassvirales sp.]